MFDKVMLEVIHDATALATCVEELDECIVAFKSNKCPMEEVVSALETCMERFGMYKSANQKVADQLSQRNAEMLSILEGLQYAS